MANKIKIKLCLVLIKILYYSHNTVWHCSQLDVSNNNCISLSFLCLHGFLLHAF